MTCAFVPPIPNELTPARRRDILVDGGRISALGSEGEVPIPPAALRVDARGLYLAPALWDMHAHVYAVSPLLDLPLYIAYGVTSVRDMQGCPEAGDSTSFTLKGTTV